LYADFIPDWSLINYPIFYPSNLANIWEDIRVCSEKRCN
jgi:hypothetical protein